MPGTVNGGRAAALSARGSGLRRKEWSLLLLLAPALAYFIVYHIVPLFGMVLAFQDFRIVGKSPFVGLKHFKALFSSPSFMQVILNTSPSCYTRCGRPSCASSSSRRPTCRTSSPGW